MAHEQLALGLDDVAEVYGLEHPLLRSGAACDEGRASQTSFRLGRADAHGKEGGAVVCEGLAAPAADRTRPPVWRGRRARRSRPYRERCQPSPLLRCRGSLAPGPARPGSTRSVGLRKAGVAIQHFRVRSGLELRANLRDSQAGLKYPFVSPLTIPLTARRAGCGSGERVVRAAGGVGPRVDKPQPTHRR